MADQARHESTPSETAGLVTRRCSPETARKLTNELRDSATVTWQLAIEAYERLAWVALGYPSWDAYLDAELGELRLKLPREQRREAVASMREAGMSTRAIAPALGIDQATVVRDLQHPRDADASSGPAAAAIDPDAGLVVDEPEVVDAEIVQPESERPEPKRVTGLDGKSYPAPTPKPRPASRRPLTDYARDTAWELDKLIGRLMRIAMDDRLVRNTEAIKGQMDWALSRIGLASSSLAVLLNAAGSGDDECVEQIRAESAEW